ncbi:sialate:O-sulfotransferase 2-like isoform X2 [Alosa pseudoharengus]|uniref:sialate:O-sulfotransferase 2-like isoform X2 n=1 Tax=Alosa pseudoharengus TaxID=34774 RepID=UPI003F8C0820
MFSLFKRHLFVFLLGFLVFVTLLSVGYFVKMLSNWGWKYVLFYDAVYIGCYTGSSSEQVLQDTCFLDDGKMTVIQCQSSCAERGYQYAGHGFGRGCYCGHAIQKPNTIQSNCYCWEDPASACTETNRLIIYHLELSQDSPYNYKNTIFKGCFKTPDNSTKAFPLIAFMPAMTVGKCVDFCTEKKLSLAVLAGQQCLCGFSTVHFPLHAQENMKRCLYHCPGQSHENCGTQMYNVVYQTEVQDNRCTDRSFLFAQPKQLMALASFPGSGNTWARHLIELATGFYTGSYYFDRSLYEKGFKGEKDNWKSGRTICIKTHEKGKQEIEAFDSGILLIRNPYRTLMAEFNRKYGGHIGFAPMLLWKGETWAKFVEVYADLWASHTLAWLNYSEQLYVVYYEELKRDMFIHLRGLVLFLGLPLSVDRLLCTESQKSGTFKRSGLLKLEYDPFTADMRTSIDYHVKRVDLALRAKNLTGVPDEYHLR